MGINPTTTLVEVELQEGEVDWGIRIMGIIEEEEDHHHRDHREKGLLKEYLPDREVGMGDHLPLVLEEREGIAILNRRGTTYHLPPQYRRVKMEDLKIEDQVHLYFDLPILQTLQILYHLPLLLPLLHQMLLLLLLLPTYHHLHHRKKKKNR